MSVDAAPSTIDDQLVFDADAVVEEPLIEEELLVEEVSIDGMCGVY
ncbi:MAG: mycofactocin precursor MftA [Microthrixaceae bacterium]